MEQVSVAVRSGPILVIDDDADCRGSICELLGEDGFTVMSAENGAEGLAMAAQSPPALVLCDVRMPVMDGCETLARLRASPETASVPFVFLSANVDMKEVRRGMNLGADDYLIKPFSGEDLLAAVHARLRRNALGEVPARAAATMPEPSRPDGRLMPELIAGRYRLTRRAGRGGMGAVFEALDVSSDEPVAVKFLVPHRGTAERFQRECAVLSRLHHPRVVHYRERGVTRDGDPFLVMDWLAGEDLATRLTRGNLGFDEGARVLRCAAEALAAVHGAGVVHRDVKPGNLFLVDGEIDRLVLIDFGIARTPGAVDLTGPCEVLGTPGYLAPEQLEHGDAATPSSDVFSLACTVYSALVGQSPFLGATVAASLARLLSDELPAIRTLRPDIPPALDAVLTAMLERDPAARPRDGQGVLDRLSLP